MKNTKIIKILLSIVIMIIFIGCGDTTIGNSDNKIKFNNFGITKLSYNDDSDWDAEVQNVFGSEYRVADWNDLKAYYNNGGDLLNLFDNLGLTEYDDFAFVTRDGDKRYSSTRYYFASRHEGHLLAGYLAHENLGNYTISLGSWHKTAQIMVIKKNASHLTANAGTDKSVIVNHSITLIGSGMDSDGTIVSYEWKNGSTVLSTNASFTYTPNKVGKETLTFTVTDDDGNTASDSVVITVNNNQEDIAHLSKGLVAYYEFEGNANDSSGNGNDGTEYGNISYVDGVIGKAGSFDGMSNIKTPIELTGEEKNQYITISFWGIAKDKNHSTFVTNYNFGDGSQSISLNARSAGIVGGFDGHYYSDGFCYKYPIISLDSIKNTTSNCGTENYYKTIYDYGSKPVDFTKWHYYSITYNNKYEKIYIDGTKVIEQELEANLIGGENGVDRYPRNDSNYDRFLNIGMYNNSFSYSQSSLNRIALKGKIDDLRIYNRALNDSEIKELYKIGQVDEP